MGFRQLKRKASTGRGHVTVQKKLGLEEWEVKQLRGERDFGSLRMWQTTAGKKQEIGISRMPIRLHCWAKKKNCSNDSRNSSERGKKKKKDDT